MGQTGYAHPDPAVEALKQAVSLADIVQAAGVTLTGTPPHLKGLCPLHPESTPSFTLTLEDDRQLWHCFGCQKGGDVFDFLAAKDGMAFPQALQHLRALTGLSAPPKAARPPRAPAAARPTDLPGGFTRRDLLEQVTSLYQARLRETREGRDYLAHRHLDVPELWQAFRIGYADGSLLRTLGQDSPVKAALQALGVVNAQGREHLYGCIVVPLEHPDEGIVGLYGRRIRPDAHIPHVYLPGPHQGVLNWQTLKLSGQVLVAESVLDALSVWVAGRRDVTCLYGASGLHPALDTLLERYGVGQVTFCLDQDEAGQAAVKSIATHLRDRRIRCFAVALPGHDPNAVLCDQGPTALKQALAHAEPVGTPVDTATDPEVHLTDDGVVMTWGPLRYRLTPRPPFNGSRLKVLLEVQFDTTEHTDTVNDLYSERQRAHQAKKVARALALSPADTERHLGCLLRETQRWVRQPRSTDPTHSGLSAPPPPPMTEADREAALALLRDPQLMARILEHTEALGHVGDNAAKHLLYLVSVSRRQPEPLSAIVLSQSGTGKSTLSALIQRLTPPEDVVAFARVSPKALSFLQKDAVKQRLVTMEEGVGVSPDAQYAVRVLQTAPVFRSAITVTDPLTGDIRTRVYEVDGPIAYIETTTNPNLNHENATRAFEVTLDESEAQTRRIHERQRQKRSEAYMLAHAADWVDPEAICHLHHSAQRLLRPLLVLNRFGEHLTFPSRRPRTRRDHERFLSLVDTVALLHQYQRERRVLQRPSGPVEYVVATVDDYRMAYDLAKSVLDMTLHELSRHGQDLKALIFDKVTQQTEGDLEAAYQTPFTRRQLREATQWEDHRLRDTLAELVTLEHLAVQGGGAQGSTYRYRLLPDPSPGVTLAGLTTPEEMAARMGAVPNS